MWDSNQKHTRIKLCEFETLDSAYEASQLGIDALGFHFLAHHKYDDRVKRFSEIFKHIPKKVQKVLLADIEFKALVRFCQTLAVDTIQLYPDWDKEKLLLFRRIFPPMKILKVLSAKDEENRNGTFDFIRYYETLVDGFLLDSWKKGGTGLTADWNTCAGIVRLSSRPVFLAGGLKAKNVEEALRIVRPFGVDVETGVSDRIPNGPLVKNLQKCREFVEEVKRADRKFDSELNTHQKGYQVCKA